MWQAKALPARKKNYSLDFGFEENLKPITTPTGVKIK